MEIKRFDDFIICPIPAESELDQVEIEKIVIFYSIPIYIGMGNMAYRGN